MEDSAVSKAFTEVIKIQWGMLIQLIEIVIGILSG